MSSILSGSVSRKVISDIPFSLAGNRRSPEETWLPLLWSVCLKRCSDNAQPFLKGLSMYELTFMMGVRTFTSVVVSEVGAGIGAVVPGTTAARGAVVGARIAEPAVIGVAVVVGGVMVMADWLMKEEEPQKKPKND